MSDGPKVVNWDYKGQNSYVEALNEATEPCAYLKLLAHGTHVSIAEHAGHVGDELDEALLIPQSWFERLEQRVAAVEELLKPVSPEVVDRPVEGFGMVETGWEDQHGRRLTQEEVDILVGQGQRKLTPMEFVRKLGEHHVEETMKGLQEAYGGQPTPGPVLEAWLKGSQSERSILFAPVLFEKAEMEGLDLAGFKALLREKFQEIGDELVAAFLKR